METRRTVRLSINGLVQGVAFRAWLRATAQDLGVTGWVRNRRDGTVEAVLQGPPEEVTDVLRRCAGVRQPRAWEAWHLWP